MKILVLTSRYTATRDIIEEDFGRQTRLFEALAKYGHEITFFCADYRKFENKNLRIHGIDVRIRPFSIWGFHAFASEFKNTLKNEKWNWLIATSDPLWGILACRYAKKYNVKFLYDLHDNYDVYDMHKLPFFGALDRNAVRKADVVTTVSHALKKKLKQDNIRQKDVFVVQNGADTKVFRPMNMKKCRKALHLPLGRKIIAYAGSLQRIQGIDVLIEAFRKIKQKEKNAMLAIAGRFYRNEESHIDLKHEGINHLGSITQNMVAKLINAADVTVVPNRDNDFTRYCFPYKIAEYAACERPIVCTDVGDAVKLIGKYKNSICKPDDAGDMAEKIIRQLKLNGRRVKYGISKNTWYYIAGEFDRIIRIKK